MGPTPFVAPAAATPGAGGAEVPAWLMEPWKPSGALWRPPTGPDPSAGDPSGGPHAFRAGGGTAGSSLPSPSTAAGGAAPAWDQPGGGPPLGGVGALNVNLPATLLRQIELKAAAKPLQRRSPHKSPWRPPGKNDRVGAPRREERSSWTPALGAPWRGGAGAGGEAGSALAVSGTVGRKGRLLNTPCLLPLEESRAEVPARAPCPCRTATADWSARA